MIIRCSTSLRPNLGEMPSFLRKAVKSVQTHLAKATAHLQNVLFGIDAVKINHNENFEKENYEEVLKEYVALSKKEIGLWRLVRPLTEILGTVCLSVSI